MSNKKHEAEIYRIQLNHYLDTTSLTDKSVSELSVLQAVCDNIHRPDLQMKFAKQMLTFEGDDNITKQIIANAHKVLSVCYEKEKNYPKSLEHERIAHELEVAYVRNMMTEDAGRKVIRAESERDLLLKQQEVDKQRWVSILGFSIVVLMLIGGVIFYRFYKREQERKNELSALNATKDRLFAILSHDLMSPVATLKNYTMLMDWGAMDQAEFTESVQSLKTNVNNLYLMLENVLHWSITQMKGIKAKIEKVNISEVIQEQVALLEPIAKGKNIRITQAVPSGITIDMDRNHLALIIRNLLQNALKFTHSGGIIQFNGENTEGGYQLRIQDNGIGMAADILTKLFKVEENANRTGTAKEGGTGLGLILTKELVELNGGKITVSSEEGRGATFSIVF
jgi:signal transduction histidine kinase